MSNTKYLFANWKMYLDYDESINLAKELVKLKKEVNSNVEMTVFPSSLAFKGVKEILEKSEIKLGAQNVYWVDKGGYTGEVSVGMYKDLGAEFVLVGHSERRHVFNESNHDTRQKMEAVLQAGLTPLLCVGETLVEREKGQAEEVVEAQLRSALDGLNYANGTTLFIAYEPVWAIGTGESCDAAEAEKMHSFVSQVVQGLVSDHPPVILYGGSVRETNVMEYLKYPLIHGVLVGGAATKIDSWTEIVKNATMLPR